MIRLLSLALMSVIVMIVSAQMLMNNAPPSSATATGAAETSEISGRSVDRSYYTSERTVLKRQNGQFYVGAQVNGLDTRFLVDTGADVVALTIEDAEQLGIPVNPGNFRPITKTASGTGYGEVVTIESMEIAGRQLANVEAVVIDGLDVNLLGQSVLRQLGKIELHGEELVINH